MGRVDQGVTGPIDASVPAELPPALVGARWFGSAGVASVTRDGAVTVAAPACTDWFHDPTRGSVVRSAPMLLAPTRGPARLSARVQVDHRDTFDAGVLMVFEGADLWSKVCLERAPDARNLVVSVVTRGHSDDANAFEVRSDAVHLRVTHRGTSYAIHASVDGVQWEFVRHMRLGGATEAWWGVGVQAPVGPGCTATFSDLSWVSGDVGDLRDGS